MKKIECPEFILGEKLTEEQFNYFDKYGVIIFRNFLTSETVQSFIQELNRIEKR
jgi:phytanoyl-CoA hydroxylase